MSGCNVLNIIYEYTECNEGHVNVQCKEGLLIVHINNPSSYGLIANQANEANPVKNKNSPLTRHLVTYYLYKKIISK